MLLKIFHDACNAIGGDRMIHDAQLEKLAGELLGLFGVAGHWRKTEELKG